jgi:hypothetical protein
MGRTVAIVWHASFSLIAGALYALFVLPRWWELTGQVPHLLGTALRIVTAAFIALAALPVVFTLLRTRKPEFGTPQLALTLRIWSIVGHVLAGVLIAGTAVSEIWLSLDDAGQWLFGIYGAAAAVAILAIAGFYLSFVAELPPPPPKPLKPKKPKRRWRDRKKDSDDATDEPAAEEEAATAETDTAAADEQAAEEVSAEPDEAPEESAEPAEPEDAPAEAEPVPTGGLKNRRPSGKANRTRRSSK